MRVEETSGGSAGRLGGRAYRELRRATETYREELVLRLAAEAGLRPTEMTRIRPEHITRHVSHGRTHHFLEVPDEDGGIAREAYLPDDVEHDLRQFVRVEGIERGERILPVTPRRVQMLVSEVGDRAAARTGDDTLAGVSTRTLRRYFARNLLVEEEIHPRIVQAIGGWEGLASLAPYLEDPTLPDIAAAFEGAPGSNGAKDRELQAFRRAVEHADHVVYVTDEEGVIEYVNPRFEEVTGYTETDVVGRSARILGSDEEEESVLRDRWETISEGDIWEGELHNQRKNGDRYRVSQTIVPITDDDDDDVERFVVVSSEHEGSPAASALASGRGPTRVDEVFQCFRETHAAIAEASTRGETERIACERLAAADVYRFAWLGEVTGERLRVRAHAGIDDDAVTELAVAEGASAAAIRTGEVRTTDDVGDDSAFAAWREHAREEDYRAAAAVPVVDGESTYGVLHVAADAEFSSRERALLADFGERLGQAITVAKQQKLLLADTVTELEVRCTDPDSFFAAASAEHDCTFRLEGIVPGEERSLLYFVTLKDAPSDEVLRWASDLDVLADARIVRDYGEEALLEFVLTGTDCSKTLAKRGATVQEMTATGGTQRVIGEVTTDTDVRYLVDVLTTIFPETELASKQELERAAETATAFRTSLSEELTEKQATVLRAAYHAGYFEWPRGSTAEELADSIGITSPTLHNHLRRAQQKLLSAFFEDGTPASYRETTPWTGE